MRIFSKGQNYATLQGEAICNITLAETSISIDTTFELAANTLKIDQTKYFLCKSHVNESFLHRTLDPVERLLMFIRCRYLQ